MMRRAFTAIAGLSVLVLACLSPFACVYGCRAAWTAGGRF